MNGITFFITCNQQADLALWRCCLNMLQRSDHKSCNRAFHVNRTAAIHNAICNITAKRRMRPIFIITLRDNIGMASKTEMRLAFTPNSKQIINPLLTLTKRQAMAGKASV